MDLLIKEKDLEYLKDLIKFNKEATQFLFKLESAKDKKLQKLQTRLKKKQLIQEQGLEKKAKEFKNSLIKNQTPSETKMKAYLKLLNIQYVFQDIRYYDNSFYIVDFFLPLYNSVIEIDGEYHDSIEQHVKDTKRTVTLYKIGVKEIYRFTNNEVLNAETTLKKLKKLLKIK